MNTLDIITLATAAALFITAAAVTLFAQRSRLGDSPWYWVCIFSMSAAVALFVMDGKYRNRQDHIENQYRFGTRTLAGSAESQGPIPVEEGVSGSGQVAREDADASSAADSASPGVSRLISLWPLRVAAIVAMLISWGVLLRNGRKPREITGPASRHRESGPAA